MRVLVIGGSGLLGSQLVPMATSLGFDVVAPNSKEFDLRNLESIASLADESYGPIDAVINLAAYTNVDGAERDSQAAFELNALAPGYLANISQAIGARLLHVSTDYVFDGEKSEAYLEYDVRNPIQVYGASKAEGEIAVLENRPDALLVRVSWLFGPSERCFPVALINRAKTGAQVNVVSDQYGVPTSATEAANTILQLLSSNQPGGIYHAVGSQPVSRFEYASAIRKGFENVHGPQEWSQFEPVQAIDFPTPARRPRFSVLAPSKVCLGLGERLSLDARMIELFSSSTL